MRTVFTLLFLGYVLSLGIFASVASAQSGEQTQTTTTDHYKVTLTLGPLANMLMPDQAAGAKEGEVMLAMGGMAMPSMSTTDDGHPVNHHLEIHAYDKITSVLITDTVPTITITDQAAGKSRQVSPVAAMYDVKVGQSDTHFGNNVYLSDGKYTVSAVLGKETATFSDVTVGAPATPPPASSSSIDYTWLIALAVVVILAVVVGIVFSRRRASPRL